LDILVKVGAKRADHDPSQQYDWLDGQIISIKPSGSYAEGLSERTRKSHCVIETPHDYFSLFNASGWDDLCTRSLFYDFKKRFYPANFEGKFPFIETKELDYETPHRIRDYFIDFKRLLDAKIITDTQYKSIYDKSRNHDKIYLDRDPVTYILNENDYTRLTPSVDVRPGTIDAAGTYTVGTGQTYADWSDAIADLPADIDAITTPGNITLRGNTNEVISENTALLIALDTGAYTLTLDAASGVKHSGIYDGHRISFTTASDTFSLDETNADTLSSTAIRDLAFLIADGAYTGAAAYVDIASTPGTHIFERNIVSGVTKVNLNFGIRAANQWVGYGIIARNNIIYGVNTGLHANCTYATSSTVYYYNNTVAKCTIGVHQDNATVATTVAELKNNLCQGNTTDYVDDGAGWGATATNVSEDATSPDGGAYINLNCHDATSCFTDYDANNYLLAAGGTELTTLDDGENLSGTFTDDIIGTERVGWYIGASEYVAAGGAVDVSAGTDALVITEYATTVNKEISFEAGVDALAITEYATTINAAISLTAGLDTLAITEYAAIVAAPLSVTAGLDTLVITEHAAGVSVGIGFTAGLDTLTITEYAATVNAEVNFTAGLDTLVVTEYAADVSIGIGVAVGLDTLVITEYAATVAAPLSVTAGTDALAITEYAAGVNAEVSFTAGLDALIITENAATVNAETNIQATLATLVIAEYAASVAIGGAKFMPEQLGLNQMEGLY